jgi:hypothetical protein
VTATVSVVALWNFELRQPGGLAEFVLSNWFFWLMLSLLVFLPVRGRRAGSPDRAADAAPSSITTTTPKLRRLRGGRRQVAVKI